MVTVIANRKVKPDKNLIMKAIMIIYNQAHTEKVEYLLDKLGIKGYSLWENVQGRGTRHRCSSPGNSCLA